MRKVLLSLCLMALSTLAFSQVINENFTSGLPAGWTSTFNNDTSWVFNNPSVRTITGTGFDANFAIIDSDNRGSGKTQHSFLTTNSFSTTGMNVVMLKFAESYRTCCGSVGYTKVSTDGGTTWDTVGTNTSSSIGYPNPANFTTIDITSVAANSASVMVEWDYQGSYDWWWAIDSVVVEASSVACVDPIQQSESAITFTSTTLSWVEQGTATQWQVEYDATGFAQGTGNLMTVNTDTFLNVTGLMAETNYDWYVRAICGPGDTSNWTGASTFFTGYCGVSTSNSSDYLSSITSSNATQNISYTASSQPAGSYANESAQVLTSYPGGAFDINTNYVGGNNGVNIWVDWNNDLDFDDMGEVIGNASGSASHVIPVSISSMASTGSYRMRIRAQWNATDPPACGNVSYGSTVDFTLTLNAPPACPPPSMLSVSSTTATGTTLSWVENGTATQWQVEYDTSGFMAGTGRNAMIVNTDTFLTVTGLSSATSYDFVVRAICGPSDTSTWSGVSNFNTLIQGPNGVNCTSGNPSVVFMEEFDNNNAGWTGDIGSGGGDWEIPDASGSSFTGASSAHSGANFMNFEATSSPIAGGSIISPAIDLTAGMIDAELSFWLHAYGIDMGDLAVGVGTSATGPFTTVFSYGGQIQTSGTDPWTNVGVNLSAYIGQVIYLEFSMSNVNGYRSDMSIDLVEVTTCASCSSPTANMASGISSSGATFSWIENGTATQWQVEYDTTGFTLGTGNMTIVNTDTFLNVTGLMAITDYEWYVRAICGSGDTSAWSVVNSFSTPCNTFTAPFSEDFSTFVPVCWDEAADGTLATGPTSLGSGEWTLTNGAAEINLYNTGTEDWLVSPTIDFGAGGYELAIDARVYAYNSPGTPSAMGSDDTVHVAISTDNGATWTSVYSWNAGNTPTNVLTTYRIDLTAYTGSSNIIGFYASEGSTDDPEDFDIELDNFELRVPPACPMPIMALTSAVSSMDATVNWTETGTATEWEVEYDTAGFTLGTGRNVVQVLTDTFTTVTGLSANTAYDWYVRAVCGAGDSSTWTTTNSFTTLSAPVTAPYSQDFEGATPLSDFTTMIGSDATLVLDANSNCAATNSLHMTGGSSSGWSGSSGLTGTSATQAWVTNTTKQSSASLNVDATTLVAAGLELSFDLKQEWSYGPGYSWARILVDGTQISPDYRPTTQNADPCSNYIIDLTPYVGTSFNLTFQFAGKYDDARGSAGQGDNAFFDNIQLIPITCPDPTNLSASNITASSADLAWTENGTATTWNVEYDLQGFTPGTGTTVVASATTQNVTGLSIYATYDFYVQADCGADSSRLVGPFSFTTGAPLAGQYTIDSTQATSATNFESFSAFGTAINAWGVSAAVDVSVAANTYNDQLSLGEISGTSNLNFITIDGNGAATLTHDKSIRNSTITIEGTSWLTIKNMTIAATGGLDSWGIHMFDSAHHIAIDSNVIQLPVGTTGDVAGIISSSTEDSDVSSGSNAYDITISNNSITGGENGMSMRGDFTATNRNANITITNNVMTDNDDRGIYIAGWDNVVITGNIVNTPNNTGSDAFYSSDLENFDISGNYFSGNDFGMDMDDSNFDNNVPTYSTISNNMVIGGDDALSLDDVDSVNIFHNSLYAADWALILNDDSNLDIRNNIFYSVDDHALNSDDGNVHVMDNNIFFTGGTADLVEFGTSNYADLAAFQTGEPTMNISSLQGDPSFVNNGVDLHISGSLPNDVGDNTVGITVDIDGDARPLAPSTTVDIGADEFAPPACLAPTANAATNVTGNSADVSWIENGTATQWEVQYGSPGFMAGNGSSIIVNTDTFTTISGLSLATAYDWYVRTICGPGDTSIWTAVGSFATICPAPSVATTLPFIEGWENNSGTISGGGSVVCTPTHTWAFTSNDPGGRVRFGSDAIIASGGSGAVTLDRDPSGAVTANDLVLTIDIAASSAATDLELLFDYAHHGEENHPNDSVWIRGSSTDSWVGVYDLFANQLANDVYQTVGPIDIDAALSAAGQTPSTSFQVRLGQEDNFPASVGVSNDGYTFDNIVIRNTPSCFAPISLVTSQITTTSADFSWDDTSAIAAPEYEYNYGAPGFTPGTGIPAIVASDSVTVNGLMGATDYEWYVRAICGPGDTSLWSVAASFTTQCVPSVAPITESFNTTSIPTCWSQSAVLDGPWVFGTPGFTWNTQGCAGIPSDVTGNGGNYAALDFSGTGVVDVVLEMNDVDVSGLTNPYLDFYFYMCGLTYTPINILYVEAFDGTNWNIVDSIQEHTNGWKRYGFDISNNTYATNLVRIRFRASSAGNTVTMFRGDQAIDDVTIGEAPSVELRGLELIRPISGCGLSATDTVEFAFVNEGAAAQTGFNLAYTVNGTAITPETFTGTVQPGDTATFKFLTTVDLSMPGVYDIQAYTSAAGDFNVTNDSAETSIVSNASTSSFPYSESFESGNGGWIVSGTGSWELGVPAGQFIDTASNGTQAWVTDLDAQYASNELAYLNSPCFDFTNIANPYISMDIWYDIESQWDGSVLEASIDDGATWSVVGQKNDPNNWYNDSARIIATLGIAADGRAWTGDGTISGVPGTNGWVTAERSIAHLGGSPSVRFRMVFASDGNTVGDGMAFDNVSIIDSMIPDPYYPIGVINTEDATTGVADSLNVFCFTSGTVVGIDLDGNAGISFYIVDQSSGDTEGINVFNFNDVSNYVVTEGDSILIHGEVIQFNGLTEVDVDSIEVISTGNTLPMARLVTDLTEAEEADWLTMDSVVVLAVNPAGAGTNYDILTLSGDTVIMRIDNDTDIDDSTSFAVNDTICKIFGIGGQFDSSNPFTDGYQIFPMQFATDIDTCLPVSVREAELANGYFELTPNPSNGEFVIRTNGFENSTVRITIREISGRIVSEELINNANNAFQKSIDLSENAKGVYFISIQDGDLVTNKKLILQ